MKKTVTSSYIVTKTHSTGLSSLDMGTAFVCNTLEDAKAVLQREWQEYYNEEKENSSSLNEEACYCDEDFGRIVWEDGEFTEYRIIDDVR